MVLATRKCLIDGVYYSQIDYREREGYMVAVDRKKLDVNEKYLGKLADIKIRVPSDEENSIPDYRKVIKDYAAKKGMSVNNLL